MVAVFHEARSTFGDTIHYMEQKCSKGTGMLLEKNIMQENPKLYWKELHDIAATNERVKNKCLHISINLPPGDHLSQSEFTEMGNLYLDKMGYSNCPYVMYAHNDKTHSHIHLIVSSVDFDSKWINDSFSHDRSFSICRELEEQMSLNPLEPIQKPTRYFSFTEKAMKDFSFRNGLRRANTDPKAKTFLSHYLNNSEKNQILKGNNNNMLCKMMLEDRFETLNSFLMEKGYSTTHIKEQLLNVMDKALLQQSKDDYFSYLNKNGISISIHSEKGKTRYTYISNDYKYNFKENRLPKNFSYHSISEKYGSFKGEYVPEAEQKHMMYSILRPSLSVSENMNDFFAKCQASGVNYFLTLENQEPKIYFSLNDINNSTTLKGEDIYKMFSYDHLDKHFSLAEPIESLNTTTINDIAITSEKYYPQHFFIPSGFSGGGHSGNSDEFAPRKKKKIRRNQNRSLI